jgi:hypothetical protein
MKASIKQQPPQPSVRSSTANVHGPGCMRMNQQQAQPSLQGATQQNMHKAVSPKQSPAYRASQPNIVVIATLSTSTSLSNVKTTLAGQLQQRPACSLPNHLCCRTTTNNDKIHVMLCYYYSPILTRCAASRPPMRSKQISVQGPHGPWSPISHQTPHDPCILSLLCYLCCVI